MSTTANDRTMSTTPATTEVNLDFTRAEQVLSDYSNLASAPTQLSNLENAVIVVKTEIKDLTEQRRAVTQIFDKNKKAAQAHFDEYIDKLTALAAEISGKANEFRDDDEWAKVAKNKNRKAALNTYISRLTVGEYIGKHVAAARAELAQIEKDEAAAAALKVKQNENFLALTAYALKIHTFETTDTVRAEIEKRNKEIDFEDVFGDRAADAVGIRNSIIEALQSRLEVLQKLENDKLVALENKIREQVKNETVEPNKPVVQIVSFAAVESFKAQTNTTPPVAPTEPPTPIHPATPQQTAPVAPVAPAPIVMQPTTKTLKITPVAPASNHISTATQTVNMARFKSAIADAAIILSKTGYTRFDVDILTGEVKLW